MIRNCGRIYNDRISKTLLIDNLKLSNEGYFPAIFVGMFVLLFRLNTVLLLMCPPVFFLKLLHKRSVSFAT